MGNHVQNLCGSSSSSEDPLVWLIFNKVYRYDYQRTPTLNNQTITNLDQLSVSTPKHIQARQGLDEKKEDPIPPESAQENLEKTVSAENSDKIFESSIKEDKILYADGSCYIGRITNGQRSGTGKFLNPDNVIIYEGQWQNDVAHGEGKLLIDNDLAYVGCFEKGMKNGKGKICSWDEEKLYFEGLFKEGEKSGYGEEKFPDGSVYKGFYSAGARNGKGKYYLTDGSYYEGEFKQDKIEGRVWDNLN